MTKFETVGVSFQNQAINKNQAIRSFQYSCNCCCTRGMKIDCDYCAINHAHQSTIALLDDLENGKKIGKDKEN